jgi:hypothetical protein
LDDVSDGQIRFVVVFIVRIRNVTVVNIIIIVVAVAVVQVARNGQVLAEERLPTTVQFTIDATAESGSAVCTIVALRSNGNRHGRMAGTRRRIDVKDGPRVAHHGREFTESRTSSRVTADQRGGGGGAAPPQTVHQRR